MIDEDFHRVKQPFKSSQMLNITTNLHITARSFTVEFVIRSNLKC